MAGIVTGAAIVALKYREGVVLVADRKLSYGRMNRIADFQRIEKLANNAIFCSSGDVADHQHLAESLRSHVTQEMIAKNNDFSKCIVNAQTLHNYLSRLQYYKRTRIEPIFAACIVAGLDGENAPFLGYSDVYGTSYKDNFIVTGLGKYFAIGLIREEHNPHMTRQEATDLALRCMRLLFLRDCAASDVVQVAYVTSLGVEIGEPIEIKAAWEFKQFLAPTSKLPIAGCQF